MRLKLWYVLASVGVLLLISCLILTSTWTQSYFRFYLENKLRSPSSTAKVLCDFDSEHNLIIGAATSLPILVVWRFARSARSTCRSCSISLFIHETEMRKNDFIDLATIYNITWLIYENFNVSKSYPQPGKFINRLRWWLLNDYFNFISIQKVRINNVFLTDVRDVVFQTNIFEQIPIFDRDLYVFGENPDYPIRLLRKFELPILSCFGKDIAHQLANKTSMCAGTTLGSWTAIRLYVASMHALIASHTHKSCIAFQYDQYFHYFLIYLGNLSNQINIHQIPHKTGFVASMAHERTMLRNRFGLVLNANRNIYAVVHHIEYTKQLVQQYKREFQLLPDNILSRKH